MEQPVNSITGHTSALVALLVPLAQDPLMVVMEALPIIPAAPALLLLMVARVAAAEQLHVVVMPAD
jgi:hypothetical protein